MANATQAPANAGGPNKHTQNQANRPARRLGHLTDAQINFLLSGIHKNRIGKDGKGFSHVEAWDIRRHLIRVFGFGGFDTDLISLDLVAQVDIPAGNKTRYTVVYRAAVKLTVKVDGVELGHWHGTAIGDATNQPGLADAHDLALKTADSQALKRAAVNMGDQFGLSLYNDGSLEPVVNRSLAYMKPQEAPKPAPEDPPVKPEPQPAVQEESGAAPQDTQQPQSSQSTPQVMTPEQTQAMAVEAFKPKVLSGWNNVDDTHRNLLEAKAKSLLNEVIPAGPDKIPTRIEDLLKNRLAELKAGRQERNAA